ncbi:hypothetical protein EMCRGX_G004926 [Ephydatia muelleri]
MSTTELSAGSQPSGKEDSCPFNDRQLAWLSTVMAKGASQPQPSSSKWIRGIVVFVWLAEGTGYRVGKALSTSMFDVPTFTPQASSEGQLEVPLSGLVPVSLSHTPPSFDPISGLPARLVKRILEFEFVEMADMLPDAWQEESQSGTDGNPMVRRLVRCAPLTEITLWLEGFARLASVLTTKHPTKSAELWAYQSAIIRAARNFEGTAWVAYDRIRLIGFVRGRSLKSASANMFSSFQHPDIIQEYISKVLDLSRMLGPLDPTCYTTVHINRFGVVPKGHNTGKWRLITDLSYPPRHSVNDGIDPELCSLHYTSVDDVATVAAELGQGALMAKGQIFADPMLPFGLRSAPKIFNAIADALEWYLKSRGIAHVFHYLDDFTIVGSPSSDECMRALSVMRQVCVELGIPLAEHKTEGPASRITFLGIMIDKIVRVQSLLTDWGDRKSCLKKELESLIGTLNHACKVIRPGRSFLRRMIDLLKRYKMAHHQIRLNREFRSDLRWWTNFIVPWNGVSYLLAGPTSEFASDASGSWGCGAHTTDSWFQIRWDEQSLPFSITIKELLPIMVAAVVWGTRWRAQKVLCHCDNQAVVAVLNSRSSSSTQRESGKDSHPATGDPGRHVGGLDVTNLDTLLQGYFRNGLAPSTHRSYDCALRRFNSFCVQYNVSDPFPVTEKLFCYCSTKLANDGLAPQTIKESSLPVLKRVLDGIRRTRASDCRASYIRLPITVGVLRQIHIALGADISEPDGLAFWAIATSAFFGFFRLGELLMGSETEYSPANHLSWGDVALDTKVAANIVKILLKKSKCDQFGAGADVLLGHTGCLLCPVAAMIGFINIRGSSAGYFFIDGARKPITKPRFVAQLRGYMKAAGLPSDQFAGHSFRIGAATTAARAGIEDSMIQTLGRWHSAAFLSYIRTSHDRLAALSVSLAKVD